MKFIKATCSNKRRKLSENECVSLVKKCKNLYELEIISNELSTKTSISHIDVDQSVFVKTALINGYAKYCHNISKCCSIFNSIPNDKKDLVIICSMMDAFIKFKHFENALSLYDITNKHQISLNNDEKKLSYFYNLAIKACKYSNNIQKAKEIESFLKQYYPFLCKNKFINTSLITLYGNMNDILSALNTFNDNNIDNINFNVSSLNAIMTILIDNDENNNALSLYQKFKNNNKYDYITHLLVIKACIALNDYKTGKIIINDIKDCDYYGIKSIKLQNTMMDFYGYFRKIDDALNIFNAINNENKISIVSINIILKVLINGHRNKTALTLYKKHKELIDCMQCNMCHLFAIKACINSDKYNIGKEIIKENQSSFDKDIKNELYIKSILIDFYGHFNQIQEALEIFNSISNNLVSIVIINCIINALIDNNLNDDALSIYYEYKLYDNITHILALKACGNLQYIEKGKEIHEKYLNKYLYDIDYNNKLSKNDINIIISSLINFYDKINDINCALSVFETYFVIEKKDCLIDIITLNSILNLYYNHEMYQECINLFEVIANKKVIKNKRNLLKDVFNLYSIVINACKDGMFIEKGKIIHDMIESDNKIYNKLGNIHINLINMYGKFGDMNECEKLLENYLNLYNDDTKVWNRMIYCYGTNGNLEKAKSIFIKLYDSNNADRNTYVSIINACSHNGDLNEAMNIWNNFMNTKNTLKYNAHIVSNLIHCLTDNHEIELAKQIMSEYRAQITSESKLRLSNK